MGNTSHFIIAFCVCLISRHPLYAEIPSNPEFKDYAHLLEASPFEIKMNEMVKKTIKPKNRNDYFIRAVTRLKHAWMIVICDRKKPKENLIIMQGEENNFNIKLISVSQNKKNFRLTKATVKIGSQEMTIGYNKSELKKAHQLSMARKSQPKLQLAQPVDTKKEQRITPTKGKVESTNR